MKARVWMLLLPFCLIFLLGCRSAEAGRYRDDPRLSPLMNAAAHDDLSRVLKLLHEGADVRARTNEGETALYESIERRDLSKDNLSVVEALLKAGADPNEIETTYHASALDMSLTRDYGNPDVTIALLKAGAKVSSTCPKGDSELSLAAQNLDVKVVEALIARHAALNCRSQNGATAMYWAALNGNAEVVSLLLKAGADPRITDNVGKTPLAVAQTTNPERRVQDMFARTRAVLKSASN